jgi:lysyl-tRNA synthetase class 2
MKRLLSRGSGDIYYLGHVWRHEEAGRSHSPEFLIAEWYRLGFSFQQMIDETIAFTELFVGTRPHHALTYRQAFRTYAHIDPYTASLNELRQACQRFQGYPVEDSSRDDLLNLLLALTVEPHFDTDAITILFHYPASQAALARQIEDDGHTVAERFEVYCGGLELANGYHELADAKEQRARFIADNEQRQQAGKEPYPIDEALIEALARGLPDCCGVAVGMDRLLMLQHKAPTIADVMPLPW